ncbi:MAG TPA: hypothetical protein VN253_28860, partial [Kofleriaceae bacterium]|nr:hypothetical protein [Kofleriaceae bacterium]
ERRDLARAADASPYDAHDEAAGSPDHDVDDAQIADEIHQLSEADYEELEHTHIGEPLDAHAFDGAIARLASPDHAAHLGDHLGHDHALSTGGEYDSAIVEDLLDAAPTYDPIYGSTLGAGRATPLPDGLTGTTPGDTTIAVSLDELDGVIDDFEILAEADADDADLLAADGEAEHASGGFRIPGADPADFAAQLDLDDDSDLYPHAPEPGVHGRRTHDPRELSAGHALAALDDDDDLGDPDPRARSTPSSGVPVSTYGRRGSDSDASHDSSRHTGFSPPHEFDQSDVIAVPPELRRDHKSRVAARAPAPSVAASAARARADAADDYDLESALDALDVDLEED